VPGKDDTLLAEHINTIVGMAGYKQVSTLNMKVYNIPSCNQGPLNDNENWFSHILLREPFLLALTDKPALTYCFLAEAQRMQS